MEQLPLNGLHIADIFVHAVFLVVSAHHIGYFVKRRDDEAAAPVAIPDFHKHIILAARNALGILLTVLPVVELVYQVVQAIEPVGNPVLHYTERVLTILAWSANVLSTFLQSKNRTWQSLNFTDHLAQHLSWAFVFVMELLRFANFVFAGVPTTTEQLTCTITITGTALYGLSLFLFLLLEPLRKRGKCMNKYGVLPEVNDEDQSVSTPDISPVDS